MREYWQRELNMETFLFYLWSLSAVFSGWKVITSKNPILSVFWLVLAFVNGALLLLLLGIEFLPILFIIVYVGAIAILFLFVVMLLNIKMVEIQENATRYAPLGFIIGLVFLYQIYYLITSELSTITSSSIDLVGRVNDYKDVVTVTNIEQIGSVLYTDYWVYFLVSSLVLLVAMVGAITLCLYHEEGIKRQDLFAQVATEYSKSVINVK
jgi:NADH-quinone oxidoreductase subunit J